MRLKISDVESALKDPRAFRLKLEHPVTTGFGLTFIGCLTDAVQHYHKANEDLSSALSYLDGRLAHPKLTSEFRKEETRAQMNWYEEEYQSRLAMGWSAIGRREDLEVPRPLWVRSDFRCSGRIGRIDMDADYGYAGWLMTSSGGEARLETIEIPLLQYALADHLDVPADEVTIGIYSFAEQFVALRACDGPELETAKDDYFRLLRELQLTIE